MTDQPTTEARHPVRIKVYGGSLRLLPPGSEWRVERITEHQQPSGSIGEPMTEWTLIDLKPLPTQEPDAVAPLENYLAWTTSALLEAGYTVTHDDPRVRSLAEQIRNEVAVLAQPEQRKKAQP